MHLTREVMQISPLSLLFCILHFAFTFYFLWAIALFLGCISVAKLWESFLSFLVLHF